MGGIRAIMPKVQVIVDNRVRVDREPVRGEVLDALRAEFTYANPMYEKPGEPEEIATWADDDFAFEISFPRGGFRRVAAILRERGYSLVVQDERVTGEDTYLNDAYDIPEPKFEPWEFQERALRSFMDRENCLVRSATGCLAEGTTILVNRAGITRRYPIERLVDAFNGGKTWNGHTWDLVIPTMVQSCVDGYVRLCELGGAVESGSKIVYEVATNSGKVLASEDHLFLTSDGWKRVSELCIGAMVCVNGGIHGGARKDKNWYNLIAHVVGHPYAGRRNVARGGWSVPKHRLVVEADMNGLSYDEFVDVLREGCIDDRLRFLDPKIYAVHHLDENPRNNALSNLAVKRHSVHAAEHGRDGGWKRVASRIVHEEVISIRRVGRRATYDLALKQDPHNFLANGFVVHNSGKTNLALLAAYQINRPMLAIVDSGGLRDQWVERAVTKLGVPANRIGIIGDGQFSLATITIAMQQTLSKLVSAKPAWLRSFGFVVADECQGAASRTLYACIDAMPAKYRLGISAHEQRQDRKQFLIYDLFGDVGAEVTPEEAIEAGKIHDVQVRIVKTQFDASWYRAVVRSGNRWRIQAAHHRLLRDMSNNGVRNDLIVSLCLDEVEYKHSRVIVLCDRIEHCEKLVGMMRGLRGLRVGLLLGGKPCKAEFDRTVRGLKSGEIDVAVGTFKATGKGIDIPDVDAVVAATPIANNESLFLQARGRACRVAEGKDGARFYALWDAYQGKKAIENLIRWSKGNVVVSRGIDGNVDAREFLNELRSANRFAAGE
jgi:hypothetical protein